MGESNFGGFGFDANPDPQIYIYRLLGDASIPSDWERSTLDTIGTHEAVAADLDGDSKPDLVGHWENTSYMSPPQNSPVHWWKNATNWGGSPPPANGDGFSATYYDTMDLTGATVTRVDPAINFNWGTAAPANGIGPDTFSVRWTGQLRAPFTERYTFYTRTDDGVRLWVDGVLLIDQWVDQSATEWSGQIDLTAGQSYPIRMEFYESMGDAVAQLSWSSPSVAKGIIPQDVVFSSSSSGGGAAGRSRRCGATGIEFALVLGLLCLVRARRPIGCRGAVSNANRS